MSPENFKTKIEVGILNIAMGGFLSHFKKESKDYPFKPIDLLLDHLGVTAVTELSIEVQEAIKAIRGQIREEPSAVTKASFLENDVTDFIDESIAAFEKGRPEHKVLLLHNTSGGYQKFTLPISKKGGVICFTWPEGELRLIRGIDSKNRLYVSFRDADNFTRKFIRSNNQLEEIPRIQTIVHKFINDLDNIIYDREALDIRKKVDHPGGAISLQLPDKTNKEGFVDPNYGVRTINMSEGDLELSAVMKGNNIIIGFKDSEGKSAEFIYDLADWH
ncbi:MAG: hypothetical protein WC568_11205 [Candidatus Methanoperedens sp.]